MKVERNEKIIPAQPGWERILAYRNDDGGISLFAEPIIAWSIESGWTGSALPDFDITAADRYHSVTPITFNESANQPVIVKRPDGVFMIEGDTEFDNEGDLLERLKEYKEIR